MKRNFFQSRFVQTAVLFGCAFLFGQTVLQAQSNIWWAGSASGYWSNVGNWVTTNGVAALAPPASSGSTRVLHFGVTNSAAYPIVATPVITNDVNSADLYQIYFDATGTNSGTNFDLFLKSGTSVPTLNDYSGGNPTIQNNSTNIQTFDMAFDLQAKGDAVGSQYADINPTSGNLVFTTNCTITLLTNTALHFYSTAGHAATINGPLLNGAGFSNACILATTASGGTGTTVIFYNTNGANGTFIYCGTARLAVDNVTSLPFILGDTNLAVAPPAILQMDNGLSNNSALVIQSLQPGVNNSRTIGNTAFGSGVAGFTGPISLGTNLTTLANAAGTLEFDGNINFQNPGGVNPSTLTVSGSGNTFITGSLTNATTGISVLTKTNSGTLTLSGTNNARFILYNLAGGDLAITNASAIGIPTGVNYPDKLNFTGNATLSVTNSFTLGRYASGSDNAGFEINGGSTGTMDVASGSTFTIAGPIINIPSTGSGNLAKIDSGTLVLQQTNTYTGVTTVSGGTLLVNGSLAAGSVVTITNATLGGTGTIGGATTLQPDSILAAGNGGTGTLTFMNSLTLDADSTNDFAVTTVGGAGNKVAVAGVLTPNNSVVSVTTGTQLQPGTNTLFTYGSVSGSFNATPVFDVAPVHAAETAIVDNGAGQITLVVPNHPPVAATLTVTALAGENLIIALANVATNWSDADGDTVTLTGINLTTTNGVTLTTNGTDIFYPAKVSVNDQISYTVTDGYGGTATGLINIAVNTSGVSGQAGSIAVNGGTATVNFAGIPGYTYYVQRATVLTGPWTDVSTNTAPGNGLFQFIDGNPPGASAYYRLSTAP